MNLEVQITPEDLQRATEAAVRGMISAQVAESRLLSTETAAGMLEVSPNHFRALAAHHKIAVVTIGPRVKRWRLTDVRRLIEAAAGQESGTETKGGGI